MTLKCFSYLSLQTGFDISCKLSKETICMMCRILFSGKNKKNITNLSPAEFAQRVVKVKHVYEWPGGIVLKTFHHENMPI